MSVPYAELHAHSAFSFLHGANLPEVLVQKAAKLGLDAIAVLDYDGMYSAVQTNVAAREEGIATVQGTEFRLRGRTHLPILANNVDGYHELCEAISEFQLEKREKTETIVDAGHLAKFYRGNWTVLTGTRSGRLRRALENEGIDAALKVVADLQGVFGAENVVVESALNTPEEQERTALQLAEVARRSGAVLVATTGARVADTDSLRLAHVLRAVRLGATLDQVEPYLEAMPPMLRSGEQMLRIHRHYPQAVENAAELAERIAFDLRLLAPDLPNADVPEGFDDAAWLRHLTEKGALERYGTRAQHPEAWRKIDHELDIIVRLGFAGYFLIVKEIVDFCRSQNILCQGRGSAANSAVCFALGITAVDAVRHKMLFERFLSPGRSGPPDIDIDIEAQRREVVIQHIYERYGRRNAAQVANVISYRPRSAVRDAAKAFGYSEDIAQLWVKNLDDAKADPRVMDIAGQMSRLPRHMGIHPGGMVLTRQPVSQICPVQWATKEDRTVLQWDKDDCAEAGLVKFDLLGLGMLTALRKMFDSLAEQGELAADGKPFNLYNLPQEDPAVYDLLCAADTVGVFQVESRAQMNTLPRLQPRCFYDIVVEVALIRPGPIQGQAVNPYLRRRRGREAVTYPHPLLKPTLEKTLGVPLFQEQLMQIAVDAAGFSPSQADQLRKAMGSKRSPERMARLKPDLYKGFAERGITGEVADQIFDSLRGFSEFGFPESHSFSFAYIVYASAWMKVHFPEEFYAAILSSQPMGFYSAASLVEDARRHDVEVVRADVNFSKSETSVETDPEGKRVRLGLKTVKGLDDKVIERIVVQRERGPFSSVPELAQRAGLRAKDLEKLAKSGALESVGTSRREAMWVAPFVTQSPSQPTLPGFEWESVPKLAPLTRVEQVVTDYETTGVSVDVHPVQMVRPQLDRYGVVPCARVIDVDSGRRIRVAGVVTHRQRPHTARGTIFLSLEDESGLANVICSPQLWQRFKRTALTEAALVVRGTVEKQDGACAVVADKLEPLPVPVAAKSRDFR
ncbi:MAG: error-prone DNA polymerase [Actinomycetaceae bacterium]|nr:error-prone DNA polymerase [Actinomycetaceae bacterium]